MKRPEPIELENNLGPDAVTGEINRVPWHAYDQDEMDLYLAEKEAEIAELKAKLPRWRKCSEEMPEEDEGVLFSDGKYIYKGCWTTWDGGCSDFSYENFSGWVEDGSETSYEFEEIKWWMPLPDNPEADK